MPCLSAVLPEFRAAPGGPTASKSFAPDREAGRARFEANVSRLFQSQALKWLNEALDQFPNLTATCRKNRVTVSPLSLHGFAVTLSIEGGRCKVILGPCREEFGSLAEATTYMTAAIGGDLRLSIDLGRRPHRWSVERRLPDGSWVDNNTLAASSPAPGTACYFRNQPEPKR